MDQNQSQKQQNERQYSRQHDNHGDKTTFSQLGAQLDQLGPTWKALAGFIVPVLLVGMLAFMQHTSSTLGQVRESQTKQSEQITNLGNSVSAMERYRDSREGTLTRDVETLRVEMKELAVQLRQVSLKLERVDARQ